LPPDGFLGRVPEWKSLVVGTPGLWETLEAGLVSAPEKMDGNGWALVKWQALTDEDLLDLAREEDIDDQATEWRRAALEAAAEALRSSAK